MMDIFKGLGTSAEGEKSVFNFLSDEDLKNLSAFFESKHIREGETLWKAEDPFDYIAFIVSGRVEIRKEAQFGDMNVIMVIYSKGALCILDDSFRKVTPLTGACFVCFNGNQIDMVDLGFCA